MRRSAKKSVLFISLSCQTLSTIQSAFMQSSEEIYHVGYSILPYVFLGMSMLVSFFIFLQSKPVFIGLLLLFRSFLVVSIGIMLEAHNPLEMALLASLIVELCLYVSRPKCFYQATFFLIIILLLHWPVGAWIQGITRADIIEFTILFVFGVILIGSVGAVRFLMDSEQRSAAETQRLDDSVRQLTSANINFQEYADVVEEESTANERNRISREIHDTVGYALTNIKMMMEAAMRVAEKDNDRLLRLIIQTREQADSGLAETRSAMRELRNLRPERLKGERAISHIVHTYESATGVRVDLEYGEFKWDFTEMMELLIYRLVQEGLTNAFRHGQASEVRILFIERSDSVTIIIRDNGRGATQISDGIGFTGMRERLSRVDGRISARNIVDGFELVANIPKTVFTVRT